jgi:hypothetical protein
MIMGKYLIFASLGRAGLIEKEGELYVWAQSVLRVQNSTPNCPCVTENSLLPHPKIITGFICNIQTAERAVTTASSVQNA